MMHSLLVLSEDLELGSATTRVSRNSLRLR